jgi:hypothetical protein
MAAHDEYPSVSATARAQRAASAVALPGTERHVLRASATQREYHIMVSRPIGNPPSPSGYPVIYMLDANAAFATMAEAVGLRSRRPEVTGIVPSVVVGIGYATDEPFDPVARTYDCTPPAAVLKLPPRPDGTVAEDRWCRRVPRFHHAGPEAHDRTRVPNRCGSTSAVRTFVRRPIHLARVVHAPASGPQLHRRESVDLVERVLRSRRGAGFLGC